MRKGFTWVHTKVPQTWVTVSTFYLYIHIKWCVRLNRVLPKHLIAKFTFPSPPQKITFTQLGKLHHILVCIITACPLSEALAADYHKEFLFSSQYLRIQALRITPVVWKVIIVNLVYKTAKDLLLSLASLPLCQCKNLATVRFASVPLRQV